MGLLMLSVVLGGCATKLLGFRNKGQSAAVEPTSVAAPAQGVETYTLPPPKVPAAFPNAVVAYFWDVEVRAEEGQHANICRALNDLLTLSASELMQVRYADYSGVAGQWNILQLLQAHFVPHSPIDLDDFLSDIEKPESREIVRLTLQDLEDFCAGKGFQADVPAEQESQQPFKGW